MARLDGWRTGISAFRGPAKRTSLYLRYKGVSLVWVRNGLISLRLSVVDAACLLINTYLTSLEVNMTEVTELDLITEISLTDGRVLCFQDRSTGLFRFFVEHGDKITELSELRDTSSDRILATFLLHQPGLPVLL